MCLKMRFLKRKATEEEFRKFEKRIRRSLRQMRKENLDLENRLSVTTKVTMALCPLSKRFTELQQQFTEIVKQFNTSSLNHKEGENKIPQKFQDQKQVVSSGLPEKWSGHLTQLEKKGLVFIGRLQNEAGSQMIPVGMLTSNLYPDRINQKIKTTVSNILKKLIDMGFIIRERRGNYWYVELTNRGFKKVKKVLHQNQLKSLVQLYEKK